MINKQNAPAIKFCGITNLADAEYAVELGAQFIGLIFVVESSRSVSLAVADQIAQTLSGQIKLVGVFKDQPLEFIDQTVTKLGLDFVQLHGDETVETCKLSPAPVIKAITLTETVPGGLINESGDALIDESGDALFKGVINELVDEYRSVAQYILFDRTKNVPASSVWQAQAIKWCSIRKSKLPPFFFAGGLDPANVQLLVSALQPFALDVASGVERAPGIKDHALMRQFKDAVYNCAFVEL